jgi:hypothetical protein
MELKNLLTLKNGLIAAFTLLIIAAVVTVVATTFFNVDVVGNLQTFFIRRRI